MIATREHFEVLATTHKGMLPTVLFLFREPTRAKNVLRFRHKRHDVWLHIFVDDNDAPIAIQFRRIDVGASTRRGRSINEVELRSSMLQFASFMVAYAKLKVFDNSPEEEFDGIPDHHENPDERHQVFSFPTPDGPEVEEYIDRARLQVALG